MSDPTDDEARVLWFMGSLERGYAADIKKIIDSKFHAAVDSAIAKGYIEQSWVLTDAGSEASERAWTEYDKEQKKRLKSFRL